MNVTARIQQTRFSFSDADAFAHELEGVDAPGVMRWAFERFGDQVVVASSFGAEDVVLVHLAAQVSTDMRIFTIDTGRLPQETYDVQARLRERYGVTFETVLPEPVSLRELIEAKGPNSFYESVENRRECCHIRKVEPLARVLNTCSAWVTGMRRDQSPTRAGIRVVDTDMMHGRRLKLNPLADWSTDDVWAFIREHKIPYNALHDQGYPSIGCAPCTRAVSAGEGVRDGRWWWEQADTKECGLHK